MRTILANMALLFGTIGFAGYLFLIISSFFGCCAGFTAASFQKIILLILSISVVIFGICMINNCCHITRKDK